MSALHHCGQRKPWCARLSIFKMLFDTIEWQQNELHINYFVLLVIQRPDNDINTFLIQLFSCCLALHLL